MNTACCAGDNSSTIGISRRWLSTFCAARCFSTRSKSTRSWATCWSTIHKPSSFTARMKELRICPERLQGAQGRQRRLFFARLRARERIRDRGHCPTACAPVRHPAFDGRRSSPRATGDGSIALRTDSGSVKCEARAEMQRLPARASESSGSTNDCGTAKPDLPAERFPSRTGCERLARGGVRANLGHELRHRTSLHQRRAHGVAHEIVHRDCWRNRTSVFEGWTLTSTSAAGNSRNSRTTGYTVGGMMLR